MSLLLASALTAALSPIAEIDLTSPVIYISKDARAAVMANTVDKLVCVDLPERSRKFRRACITHGEWQAAAERTALDARRANGASEDNTLRQQPVPVQNSPYQSAWNPQ